MTILSTTVVAARMYARMGVIHNVGWDDYTIIITQVNLLFQRLSFPGRHLTLISAHKSGGFRLSNTHH